MDPNTQTPPQAANDDNASNKPLEQPTVITPDTQSAANVVAPAAQAAEPVTSQDVQPQSEQPVQAAPVGQTPSAQTPIQPVQPQHLSANSTPKKKAGLIVAVVAAAVVLLGGSAAAYFAVVVPNKPENLLKKAFQNTLEQTQVSTKGEFELENKKAAEDEPKNFTFTFATQHDSEKPSAAGQIDFATSGVKLPLEYRMVDRNIYMKIGSLGSVKSVIQAYDPSLGLIIDEVDSKIANQWVEIDRSLLKEANAECLVETSYALTKEDINLVMNSYKGNEFAEIKNTSADTVDGRAAVKYELEFDGNKAESYAKTLEDLSVFKKLKECGDKIGGEDTVDTTKTSASSGTYEFYVWVDKGTKRISQFEMSGSDDEFNGLLKASIEYGSVNITKPENAKPLVEVLGDLQSLFFGGFDTSFNEDLLQAQICAEAYENWANRGGDFAIPAECQ